MLVHGAVKAVPFRRRQGLVMPRDWQHISHCQHLAKSRVMSHEIARARAVLLHGGNRNLILARDLQLRSYRQNLVMSRNVAILLQD